MGGNSWSSTATSYETQELENQLHEVMYNCMRNMLVAEEGSDEYYEFKEQVAQTEALISRVRLVSGYDDIVEMQRKVNAFQQGKFNIGPRLVERTQRVESIHGTKVVQLKDLPSNKPKDSSTLAANVNLLSLPRPPSSDPPRYKLRATAETFDPFQ